MNASETIWLVVELTVLFFSVTFLVQLFQRRLGGDRLRAWMGGPPLIAALKGIAIGFVTPFCTFTAIPMLLGLRQAGVPPAGYVAFISTFDVWWGGGSYGPRLLAELFPFLVLLLVPWLEAVSTWRPQRQRLAWGMLALFTAFGGFAASQ